MDVAEEAVKLVIFVPETHAQAVRDALGESGAGQIGNYSYNSFSIKGIGRYMPLAGSKPFIGTTGKLEEVMEERVETVCLKKDLEKIIIVMKKVHPYEEVAYDIYPLVTL